MDDLISRQAAIDTVNAMRFGMEKMAFEIITTKLLELPTIQPEPAIPLSWIEEQIEWLKGMDNAFSTLTAMQISVMVNKWRDEQNETD